MNVRNGSQRVKFGDVVRQVKETADPENSGLERYVAGEHMRKDELQITAWGTIGDGYLGPAFHRRFHSGQVLYGSRRTYLRKVSLADFDGICANTTFVCETANENALLPELLPFIMQTDAFHAHSITQSKGSVNPYINWPDLAWFEFDLPAIDEQREIAELLWSAEEARRAYQHLTNSLLAASQRAVERAIDGDFPRQKLVDLIDPTRPLCYGVVQPGTGDLDGTPLIRVCDIEGGTLGLDGLRRISSRVNAEYKRSVVRGGDVLISVVGTIGRVVVVPPEAEGFNIARAVARVAPNQTKVIPRFLALALLAPSTQRALFDAAFESARRTLNLSRLDQIHVPVPSLDVQAAVLTSVAEVDATAKVVNAQLGRTRALKATILNGFEARS